MTAIGLIGSFMGALILITIINLVYEFPEHIFSLLVFIGFIEIPFRLISWSDHSR